MPEIEAGVVGKVVAGVDGGGSAYVVGGEVGPAVGGGRGVAGELCKSEVELGVGSARAERPWRSGATVSSSSPAFGQAVVAFWKFGVGNRRGNEGKGMRGFPWC